MSIEEIQLPEGYKPSDDEEYMCQNHLAYFRKKLLDWRDSLMEEAQATIDNLRDDSHKDIGDEADRASRESDHTLELRTRDRYRKLLRKIDQALQRIDEGEYGYCEDTGEEIGLGRLEARPIATLTVEAQERREFAEKQTASG